MDKHRWHPFFLPDKISNFDDINYTLFYLVFHGAGMHEYGLNH